MNLKITEKSEQILIPLFSLKILDFWKKKWWKLWKWSEKFDIFYWFEPHLVRKSKRNQKKISTSSKLGLIFVLHFFRKKHQNFSNSINFSKQKILPNRIDITKGYFSKLIKTSSIDDLLHKLAEIRKKYRYFLFIVYGNLYT